MASSATDLGSLGLLLWLLLLQPWFSEVGVQGVNMSTPPVPESTASPITQQTREGATQGATQQTTGGVTSDTTRRFTGTGGCGHRYMRIVGGLPAPERKWPWQVSLQINDKHLCGGSLIGKQWVLTAAHCIMSHLEFTTKMGDIQVQHSSRMAVVVPVRDIVIHKRYDSFISFEHDIALAFLDFPVNYSTHIQPVCLPESSFRVQSDKECWVTGWGKLDEEDKEDKAPKILQEAELNIIRHEKCNEMFKKRFKIKYNLIKKGVICAYSAAGKDSCQGDSGGPLVCEYNQTWIQVGIVSWGIGCGRKELPGVYTEISMYKDWVIEHMNYVTMYNSANILLPLCLLLLLGTLVSL